MKRRFTQAEVYYLNTLPAVERASMDRITYSRDFQVRCMAQYLRGNGPTSIFASAGLNPKIVGSKRIERAIARWKADPQIMLEAQSFANEAAADQRDLLVISQSMTIAWLEKKVMDLQKQIQSVKQHEAERPSMPAHGRSSDWNSVQKRSHDKMCVVVRRRTHTRSLLPSFPHSPSHSRGSPMKEGFVSSLAAYPAIGACGQRRHSINIRQIRGTDGAAVWDGFGVYALRSAVSLAVTIACVIWLYIS